MLNMEVCVCGGGISKNLGVEEGEGRLLKGGVFLVILATITKC